MSVARSRYGRPPANLLAMAGGDARVAFPTVEVLKGKPVFPDIPSEDDHPALCRWLTVAFNLNTEMPVVSVEWQGKQGPDGHVVIHRAGGAGPLRFEPARSLNTPIRIMESMTGRRAPGDGMMWAIGNEHCRRIRYVVEVLGHTEHANGEREDALMILTTFLHRADEVEESEAGEPLTTYGGRLDRYNAAKALSRSSDIERPRYFTDTQTGERIDQETGEVLDQDQDPELVIPVGDLQEIARKHVGASIARGWLDARMQEIGWRRITIDAHRESGRIGRKGPHARCDAYRGILPTDEGIGDHVTTRFPTELRAHVHHELLPYRTVETCGHVVTATGEGDGHA